MNPKNNLSFLDSSNTPHMEASGLDCFTESLKYANCYLEYGSGASTLYAANVANIKSIISIDTDKNWVNKVNSLITTVGKNFFLEYCDLGDVGDWGVPLNEAKYKDFWKYMVTPWILVEKNNLSPDLILIDGRFRVASFLYSLLCAQEGTKILFDDYFDRPHYFEVEKFCRPLERRGRMAVFETHCSYKPADLVSSCVKFSIDWR